MVAPAIAIVVVGVGVVVILARTIKGVINKTRIGNVVKPLFQNGVSGRFAHAQPTNLVGNGGVGVGIGNVAIGCFVLAWSRTKS